MAKIQLTISLEDGKVDLNGPLQDKGLCYMLLELARDGIYDFTKRRADMPKHGPIIEGEVISPTGQEQPVIRPVETPRIIVPGLKVVPKTA